MRYARRGLVIALVSLNVIAQELPNDTDQITTLSAAQAKMLASRKDTLSLNGLQSLSPDVALALGSHEGEMLLLNGLKVLEAKNAALVARHRGVLSLDGLVSLEPEAAESLSEHSDKLFLNGLESLPVAVAKSLAKHRGDINLNGIKTLSPESATAIASHAGAISLNGLTSISDETASELAKHVGYVSLGGLGTVSDAAVAILEQRSKSGTLYLPDQEQKKRNGKNPLPTLASYEDLQQLLLNFEGTPGSSLDRFVRYGTAELAAKATNGDRFDREEADAAAATHRKTLSGRRFFLQSQYRWDQREPSEGKEGTVRLRVPLKFRCSVPGHDPKVGVADYSRGPLWFLTKEGKLQRCQNPREARFVEESNGVLYVPEILGNSELVLWVRGEREVQKTVAREPEKHVVNICFSRLRLERPATEGFYRLDAIREDDYTSGSLLTSFQNGNNGPKNQPNYFVTKQLDPLDERAMPEVVSAVLEKVKVVSQRGVVFQWSRE